jgi:hypothetical protein
MWGARHGGDFLLHQVSQGDPCREGSLRHASRAGLYGLPRQINSGGYSPGHAPITPAGNGLDQVRVMIEAAELTLFPLHASPFATLASLRGPRTPSLYLPLSIPRIKSQKPRQYFLIGGQGVRAMWRNEATAGPAERSLTAPPHWNFLLFCLNIFPLRHRMWGPFPGNTPGSGKCREFEAEKSLWPA